MKHAILKLLNKFAFILIYLCLMSIAYFFPKDAIDIILLLIFLLSSVVLYLRFKRLQKKTYLYLALFVFFNFIIFPLTYLVLIILSPANFDIDKKVSDIQKQNNEQELRETYEIGKMKTEEELITSILADSSDGLNTTLNYLNHGNVSILHNLMIYKTKNSLDIRTRPYHTFLNVSDKTGKLVGQIKNNDSFENISLENVSLRDYLNEMLKNINNKKNQYENERVNLMEPNAYWKYHSILPYSLNIFTNDNMVPKTSIANYCYLLHGLIVGSFLIGLIITYIPIDFFKKTSQD